MVGDKLFLGENEGFSLLEAIVVVAIVTILIISLIASFKPATQVNKANDAKKKNHLARFKIAFEDYYSDYNCYPSFSLDCGGTALSPYLEKIDCDPEGNPYVYVSAAPVNCPQSFRIYTTLKNSFDLDITKVGCSNGCGPGGSPSNNYCVSSPNVTCESTLVPN
jgi:Tfp pilus assembly protein PilE